MSYNFTRCPSLHKLRNALKGLPPRQGPGRFLEWLYPLNSWRHWAQSLCYVKAVGGMAIQAGWRALERFVTYGDLPSIHPLPQNAL